MSRQHTQKRPFSKFAGLGVAACCAAILLGASQAMAQGVQVVPSAEGSGEANEELMHALMGLRIAELKTACDLSDSQVKKLKVMAKVAVGNTVKSRKNRGAAKPPWALLRKQGEEGFKGIEDPDRETFSDEDDENSEARETEENGVARKPKAATVLQPHDDPVWKNAIKQVLSDEQQEQWRNVIESHRAFGRRRAAFARVEQLDSSLRLEESQRAKLLTAIEDALAKLPTSKWGEYQPAPEVLEEIFSEQQLAVYKNDEFASLTQPEAPGAAVAKLIQNQLFGRPLRPFFGASARDSEFGVELHRIKQGSPAAKAGLQDGDILTSISGQYIDTALQFRRAISSAEIGVRVTVAFIRKGEKREVILEIGKQ